MGGKPILYGIECLFTPRKKKRLIYFFSPLFSLSFCDTEESPASADPVQQTPVLLFPPRLSGAGPAWQGPPEDAASLPPLWPSLTLLSSRLGLADPRPAGQHQGLITGSLDPTTAARTGYNRVPWSIWLPVLNVKYRAEDRSRLRAPVLSTVGLWLTFAIKIQYIKH